MKREVERDGTTDTNGRRFGFRRCEPVGFDGDLIGTRIYLRKQKVADCIGCAGASGFRVYVGSGDFRVGNGCAAGVRYLAGEALLVPLCA